MRLLVLVATLMLLAVPVPRAAAQVQAPPAPAVMLATGSFTGMAVDPVRPRLYVLDYGAGSLRVWNTTTNAPVANVTIGATPEDLAVTSDGQFLYATIQSTNELAVVNLTSLTLARSIALSTTPIDVAAGRTGRAYVTVNGPSVDNYPLLVDTLTGSELATISACGPVQYNAIDRISPDLQTLYVVGRYGSPTVACALNVSTDHPTLVVRPVGPMGSGLRDASLSENGFRLFAASDTPPGGGNYAQGVCTTNWTTCGAYATGGPPNSVDVSQRAGTLFVADATSEVDAFNVSTGALRGRFNFTQAVGKVRGLEDGTKVYAITYAPGGASFAVEVLPTSFAPTGREPPVIDGAASVSWGRVPLKVTFAAYAGLGTPPYTYAWSFGDGGSGVGRNPSHSYTLASRYNVTLSVRDTAGFLASVSEIHVVVDPALLSDPLRVVGGIIGLSFDFATNPWVPPDPQLAIGRAYIVEMVNSRVGVWNRSTGVQQANVNSSVFFGTRAGEYLTDPKVAYDIPTGRWFATVADFTADETHLLVSSTSDPTLPWYHTVIPAPPQMCPDQPILGVGVSVVVVSVNLFANCLSASSSFAGPEYWVVNKSELVLGVTPHMVSERPSPSEASIHPVQVLDGSPAMYLVSVGWGVAPTQTLEVFTVQGVPPAPVTIQSSTLPIRTVNQPPNVPQRGSSLLVNTGDARVLDAFLQGGNLWITFGDACVPASSSVNQSCARILEVNPTTASVLQDFDIGDPSYGTFYPAIRPNAEGDLIVTFAESSASTFPEMAATIQLALDASNTFRAPITLAAGSGPEALLCDGQSCRFGDYFAAALDPLDPQAVWLCGEEGTPNGWGTFIAEVGVFRTAKLTVTSSFAGGSVGAAPPVLTYYVAGRQSTVPLTSSPLAVDADNGSSWSLSSSVSGADPLERWLGVGPISGSVHGPASINIVYQHQYFVVVVNGVPPGGTVVPILGWYNASASIVLSASAANGWAFGTWLGVGGASYNGSENPHTLVIQGPILEAGIFYPGLTLVSTPGGIVRYAYGNQSGAVPGGSTLTLFVPPGTRVNLTASPSFLSQFDAWSGDFMGSATNASVHVVQPVSVTARFSVSLAEVALVGVPPAVAMLAAVVLLFRRRRRPPPALDSRTEETKPPSGP